MGWIALKQKFSTFAEMIKFEHTIFALPFAYLGYFVSPGADWGWGLAWVTLAMVAARTAGMSLNRLIDRRIDAENVRTKSRALVTGSLKSRAVLVVALVSFFLLGIAAYNLNALCFKLFPVAVILLTGYHYLKRFTILCHFGIGLVLACAPLGGWMAATGTLSWDVVPLALGVFFWVAGFDIYYSMQDAEFDREMRLHSIPARLGKPAAVWIAAICHGITLSFFVALGIIQNLSLIYWVGVLWVGAILIVEQMWVVRGRIQAAFFNLNGYLSVGYFIFTLISRSHT